MLTALHLLLGSMRTAMTRLPCLPFVCNKHTRKLEPSDTQRQRYRSQHYSLLLLSLCSSPPATPPLDPASALPTLYWQAGWQLFSRQRPGHSAGCYMAVCCGQRSNTPCFPPAATQTCYCRRPNPETLRLLALGSARTELCSAPAGYAGAPLSAPRSAERSRGMQCTFRMSDVACRAGATSSTTSCAHPTAAARHAKREASTTVTRQVLCLDPRIAGRSARQPASPSQLGESQQELECTWSYSRSRRR